MADLTYQTNFLNVSFGEDDLASDVAIRDQPLMQKIGIDTEGGLHVQEQFYLNGPRGGSQNLTDAQAAASGSNHFRWQHPFGTHIKSIPVPIADVLQSIPDNAAAARALEAEVEKGLEEEGQYLNDRLIGNAALGFGEFEETAGTPTGYPAFAIRFADPSEARNFAVGDQIVVSETAADTDGTLVGETGIVVSRDVSLGYIQVGALSDPDTAANPGSWVDDTNYYVFRVGDYTDGDLDFVITSYEAFLPASAASDTFHNVDRSVDAALSGARLPSNMENGGILQRAARLISIMYARYGLKRKNAGDLMVVLNPEDWNTAAEEASGTVHRAERGETEEGYEALYVHTAVGKTAFVSEPAKNKGRGFILNGPALGLYTATGQLLHTIADGAGNIVHLKDGAMNYEIRTLAKVAVGFGAPFQHGSFSTSLS